MIAIVNDICVLVIGFIVSRYAIKLYKNIQTIIGMLDNIYDELRILNKNSEKITPQDD